MAAITRFAPHIVTLILVGVLYFESLGASQTTLGRDRLGSVGVPQVLLGLIALLTILNVVLAIWRERVNGAKKSALPDSVGWMVAGAVILLLVIAATLLRTIGFAAASVAVIGLTSWLLGYRRPLFLLALSMLCALVVWATFTYVIDLSLPTSPFFLRL